MSNLLYPKVHGLALTMKRSAITKTLVQPAYLPGWETRLKAQSDGIYRFVLNYSILFSGTRNTPQGTLASLNSLSVIESFFQERNGQFDSFLLDVGAVTGNPAESSATGQILAVDANNCAPLTRTKPGTTTTELIYELSRDGGGTVIPPVIKNDGTTLTSGSDYVLYTPVQTQAGTIDNNGIAYDNWVVQFLSTFSGPITANFGWYYRVRFTQDEQEFEMFHQMLWKANEVDLVVTRV